MTWLVVVPFGQRVTFTVSRNRLRPKPTVLVMILTRGLPRCLLPICTLIWAFATAGVAVVLASAAGATIAIELAITADKISFFILPPFIFAAYLSAADNMTPGAGTESDVLLQRCVKPQCDKLIAVFV